MANSRARTSSVLLRAADQISMSLLWCFSIDFRISLLLISSFFLHLIRTNSPVKVTIPISCPGEATVATISPILKVNFQYCDKTLFFHFKTNFNTVKWCLSTRCFIFANRKQLIYCYRCRKSHYFTTLWWATIRSWTTCTCHNFI
jgi:hypothetical protein